MAQRKVAVVTGSNKGIGFAIVRGLVKQFDGDVFLTARDEARGKAAQAELEKEGISAKFHQLDINDVTSIKRLRDFLKSNYGGLDILVNNAAMAFKQSATESFAVQAELTANTNVWGVINTCQELFPLLRPHARVVHISSFVAKMVTSKNKMVKSKFGDPNLTQDQLESMMKEFTEAAKTGGHEKLGYPNSAYGMSKVAISALTRIQQRAFDKEDDIIINSADPGYVNTDMTSNKGKKTIDEGAKVPTWCALLPANATGPKGETMTDNNAVLEVF